MTFRSPQEMVHLVGHVDKDEWMELIFCLNFLIDLQSSRMGGGMG